VSLNVHLVISHKVVSILKIVAMFVHPVIKHVAHVLDQEQMLALVVAKIISIIFKYFIIQIPRLVFKIVQLAAIIRYHKISAVTYVFHVNLIVVLVLGHQLIVNHAKEAIFIIIILAHRTVLLEPLCKLLLQMFVVISVFLVNFHVVLVLVCQLVNLVMLTFIFLLTLHVLHSAQINIFHLQVNSKLVQDNVYNVTHHVVVAMGQTLINVLLVLDLCIYFKINVYH